MAAEGGGCRCGPAKKKSKKMNALVIANFLSCHCQFIHTGMQRVPFVCTQTDPSELACVFNPEYPTALFFSDGRIYHMKRGVYTYGSLNASGYRSVSLNGRTHSVHRLIGVAFLTNSNGLAVCHHLNHDRGDNRACNLEWATQMYNTQGVSRRGGFGNVHEMPTTGRKRWKATYKLAGDPMVQRYFYDRHTARDWLDRVVLPALQYLIHPHM